MNRNERMEILKNNGVNVGKYFTLVVEQDIPAGTKINISIEGNEVAQKIIEDGYVKNTRLHRRFVAAQYFKMLESREGWNAYLNNYYGYMYTIDMMIEEVRVLSKLEKADKTTFNERKQFFTKEVVRKVLIDYMNDLVKYLGGLPTKNCRGTAYVNIKGYGNVFCFEVDAKVIEPIRRAIEMCCNCNSYAELYIMMACLRKSMIKLPYDTKKSKAWVNAFQKEGAFYTLKNLLMFHGVELYCDGAFYDSGESSMQALNALVPDYEGYQMNALLKATIDANHFNFKNSISK